MQKRHSSTKRRTSELTMLYCKEQGLDYKRILGSQSGRKYKRSSVSFRETRSELRIDICANDLAAMSASINAVLRELQAIEATRL